MKRKEILQASSMAGLALNAPDRLLMPSVSLLDLRFVAEVRGQHIGVLNNIAAVVLQAQGTGPEFYNIPRPETGQTGWRAQQPPVTPVTDVSFNEESLGAPTTLPERISVAVNIDGMMYLTPYRVLAPSYVVAVNPQGPHFYTCFLPFGEKTYALYNAGHELRVIGPNQVVSLPIMTTQLERELQSKG